MAARTGKKSTARKSKNEAKSEEAQPRWGYLMGVDGRIMDRGERVIAMLEGVRAALSEPGDALDEDGPAEQLTCGDIIAVNRTLGAANRQLELLVSEAREMAINLPQPTRNRNHDGRPDTTCGVRDLTPRVLPGTPQGPAPHTHRGGSMRARPRLPKWRIARLSGRPVPGPDAARFEAAAGGVPAPAPTGRTPVASVALYGSPMTVWTTWSQRDAQVLSTGISPPTTLARAPDPLSTS
jgi:hypothetical protein